MDRQGEKKNQKSERLTNADLYFVEGQRCHLYFYSQLQSKLNLFFLEGIQKFFFYVLQKKYLLCLTGLSLLSLASVSRSLTLTLSLSLDFSISFSSEFGLYVMWINGFLIFLSWAWVWAVQARLANGGWQGFEREEAQLLKAQIYLVKNFLGTGTISKSLLLNSNRAP